MKVDIRQSFSVPPHRDQRMNVFWVLWLASLVDWANCHLFTHLQSFIRSASASFKHQTGIDARSNVTNSDGLLKSVDMSFTLLNRAYLGDRDAIQWLERASSSPITKNKDLSMLARAGLLVLQREEQGVVQIAGVSTDGDKVRAKETGEDGEVLKFLLTALNQIDPGTHQYSQVSWFLGLCYSYAIGTNEQPIEAARYFRQAAYRGLAAAQNSFGACYELGHGVTQDYREAVRWYRKAADQGYAIAIYHLAGCYYGGHGVESTSDSSLQEAVRLFGLAAKQGLLHAQVMLGYCYYLGDGVNQDYQKAAQWFKAAADRGFSDGQFELGNCHEKGHGVPQDLNEAIKLYKLAAEQGNQDAQRKLKILSNRV